MRRGVTTLASRPRISRDVAGAEDALSEAFAAALAQWPRDGVPAKPEAWLMSVAKLPMIDPEAAAAELRRCGGLHGIVYCGEHTVAA